MHILARTRGRVLLQALALEESIEGFVYRTESLGLPWLFIGSLSPAVLGMEIAVASAEIAVVDAGASPTDEVETRLREHGLLPSESQCVWRPLEQLLDGALDRDGYSRTGRCFFLAGVSEALALAMAEP